MLTRHSVVRSVFCGLLLALLSAVLHAGIRDDIEAGVPITALRKQLSSTSRVNLHVWNVSSGRRDERVIAIEDQPWIDEVAGLIAGGSVTDEEFGQFGVSPQVEFIGDGGAKVVAYPRGELVSLEFGATPVVLRLPTASAKRLAELFGAKERSAQGS